MSIETFGLKSHNTKTGGRGFCSVCGQYRVLAQTEPPLCNTHWRAQKRASKTPEQKALTKHLNAILGALEGMGKSHEFIVKVMDPLRPDFEPIKELLAANQSFKVDEAQSRRELLNKLFELPLDETEEAGADSLNAMENTETDSMRSEVAETPASEPMFSPEAINMDKTPNPSTSMPETPVTKNDNVDKTAIQSTTSTPSENMDNIPMQSASSTPERTADVDNIPSQSTPCGTSIYDADQSSVLTARRKRRPIWMQDPFSTEDCDQFRPALRQNTH